MLADTPLVQGFAWTALAVAVLTLVRWLIDGGAAGMPFAPFFPVILIAALVFGWRCGALAALLSGIAANRLLLDQAVLFYVSWADAAMVGFFGASCALLVYMGEMLRRLVRQLEDAKAREEVLSGELRHRAKNMLTIVGAIASLTARRTTDSDFFPAFADRIDALNRATDLLAEEAAGPRDVALLVEHAVAPFRSGDNFRVDGPACEIPEQSCVPLMLVLHELCTNAAKHGALTAAEGVVTIAWSFDQAGTLLLMHWSERGGPPVAQKRRQGMGSTLMRAQKGMRKVDLRLPRAGAECDIEVEAVRASTPEI